MLREAYRVLKPGGRFAVSDVVAQGELPADLRADMEAWVGCVAGALEENEYRRLLADAGFADVEIQVTRVYDPRELAESLRGGSGGSSCCGGSEPTWDESAYARFDASGGRVVSAFVRARKPERRPPALAMDGAGSRTLGAGCEPPCPLLGSAEHRGPGRMARWLSLCRSAAPFPTWHRTCVRLFGAWCRACTGGPAAPPTNRRRRRPREDVHMPVDALRKSPMMSHLLDAQEAGQDIGHYGRLTFAMVAHHFLDRGDVVAWLVKGDGIDEGEAKALVQQVESRAYNPPSRDRILEWQAQQTFPICPDPDDPAACNVYRDLDMPEQVIEHIEEYREQQFDAESGAN